VSVPCLMVVESCQDLMTRLFVCGIWRRDLVSEYWKATNGRVFSHSFSLSSSLLSVSFPHSLLPSFDCSLGGLECLCLA
jgi:hypothetical protein